VILASVRGIPHDDGQRPRSQRCEEIDAAEVRVVDVFPVAVGNQRLAQACEVPLAPLATPRLQSTLGYHRGLPCIMYTIHLVYMTCQGAALRVPSSGWTRQRPGLPSGMRLFLALAALLACPLAPLASIVVGPAIPAGLAREVEAGQSGAALAFNGEIFLLAWMESDASLGGRVRAVRAAVDGSILDDAPIELGSGKVSNVTVASARKSFLVAWEREGELLNETCTMHVYDSDVVAARVTAEGRVDVPEHEIRSGPLRQESPSLASDGNDYLFAWQDMLDFDGTWDRPSSAMRSWTATTSARRATTGSSPRPSGGRRPSRSAARRASSRGRDPGTSRPGASTSGREGFWIHCPSPSVAPRVDDRIARRPAPSPLSSSVGSREAALPAVRSSRSCRGRGAR
jgi:hypothetical protein